MRAGRLTAGDGRVLQQLAARHLDVNHGIPVHLAVLAPAPRGSKGGACARWVSGAQQDPQDAGREAQRCGQER